jgi:protein MPE1
MVTESGEFVYAKPNEQAWNKMAQNTRNYMGLGDISNNVDTPEELKCNICFKLLNDSAQVPCCKSNFCNQCNLISYTITFNRYKALSLGKPRPFSTS